MQQTTPSQLRSTASLADSDNDTVPDRAPEWAHQTPDPDLRHRMISEAAYYLYTQRGSEAGCELDDWLQAEVEIDLLMTPRRGESERGGLA
jgi:hypothetical protein